jgi:hypothetical protein
MRRCVGWAQSPRLRTLTRLCVAFAILAVLAACSGGTSKADATAESSHPPGNSPTATTAPTAKERAVLAAYYAYWAAFASAADQPNPDSKDLARYAANPELSKAKRVLAGWLKDSSLFDGKYTHVNATATVTKSRAVVHDCMTLVGKVIDATTKNVKSETNPQPLAVSASLTLTAGQWRVTRVRNGTVPCMPASTKPPTTKG